MFGLDLQVSGSESVLKVQVKAKVDTNGTEMDMDTIHVEVPEGSSSPSVTYPVRVAIITVLAPVTIFLNDGLGGVFGFMWSAFGYTLGILLVVVLYGFMVGAVVVSIVKTFGGPSYEDAVQGIQDRLERWNQIERLRFLRLGSVQEGVDRMYHNERMRVVVEVCRHGWHPEKNREMARQQTAEEKDDVEKGLSDR